MPDPLTGAAISETINLVLQLTNELLKKIPNYDQRKKEKFYKIAEEYQRAMSVDYKYRSDNRIDDLRDQLKLFSRTFLDEIKNEKGE